MMLKKKILFVGLLLANVGLMVGFAGTSNVSAAACDPATSTYCLCIKGHFPGTGWCDDSINEPPLELQCWGDSQCQSQT